MAILHPQIYLSHLSPRASTIHMLISSKAGISRSDPIRGKQLTTVSDSYLHLSQVHDGKKGDP